MIGAGYRGYMHREEIEGAEPWPWVPLSRGRQTSVSYSAGLLVGAALRNLPRLAAAGGAGDADSRTRAGVGQFAGGGLLGFVLVEHRLRGRIALGTEFGSIIAAPLIGGSAALIEAAEVRHH